MADIKLGPLGSARKVKTQTLPINLLFPHQQNYRHHPQKQINHLVKSLERFGQVDTVTVQPRLDGSYVILSGHGICEAAKQAGQAEMECRVVPPEWDGETARAYMIAANFSSIGAEDNMTMLLESLTEQKNKSDTALESTGFDDSLLQKLVDGISNNLLAAQNLLPVNPLTHTPDFDNEAAPDDFGRDNASEPFDYPGQNKEPKERPTPEPDEGFDENGDGLGWNPLAPAGGGDEFDLPAAIGEDGLVNEEMLQPPRSQIGDIWQCGKHRLAVGSSLDPQTVAALLTTPDGTRETVDMVWTDPPYGVAYVGKTKDALTIQNDKLDEGKLESFLDESLGLALQYCKSGAVWYVCSPPGPLMLIFANVLKAKKILRQSIIWVKNRFVMGHNDFHYRHEIIFYGWKDGAAHTIIHDRTLDTVWEISRPTRNADHPTMKPVILILDSLRYSSKPNDLVFDPFGGSGSTLIACERSKRICRTIELSPVYADVILRRFEMDTGVEAEWLCNLNGAVQIKWERPADLTLPPLQKDPQDGDETDAA